MLGFCINCSFNHYLIIKVLHYLFYQTFYAFFLWFSTMDTITLELLAQFTIDEAEASLIQLDEEDVRTGLQECRSSIIGCMFGGKEINFNGFKASMAKV